MRGGPGPIILIGSGETTTIGRKVFDRLFRRLSAPPELAILETPAGFELNSSRVAGRVAEMIEARLQSYAPRVAIVAARKRGTPFSPDDPAIVQPLLTSNVLFLGAGSPTYAVRQLRDSLAWDLLRARHRQGAAVVLASAGAIAAGTHALPVYELFKVGEELHWLPGLDLLGPYGLSLAIVSHWNNGEGGAELDTSRCFMGKARFDELVALLPPNVSVLGIDEHTALIVDLKTGSCEVVGRGGVTVIRSGQTQGFTGAQRFPITALGPFRRPEPQAGIPAEVWQSTLDAQAEKNVPPEPPPEILALADEREAVRARQDWAAADEMRSQIAEKGWRIVDTPLGPLLESDES